MKHCKKMTLFTEFKVLSEFAPSNVIGGWYGKEMDCVHWTLMFLFFSPLELQSKMRSFSSLQRTQMIWKQAGPGK